ncbi:Kinesin-related protein 5 [Diplonema papillatum]|nr:Kinesin-related protein 5 [Diplonema papillatum]|eukprot:gene20616-31758_t
MGDLLLVDAVGEGGPRFGQEARGASITYENSANERTMPAMTMSKRKLALKALEPMRGFTAGSNVPDAASTEGNGLPGDLVPGDSFTTIESAENGLNGTTRLFPSDCVSVHGSITSQTAEGFLRTSTASSSPQTVSGSPRLKQAKKPSALGVPPAENSPTQHPPPSPSNDPLTSLSRELAALVASGAAVVAVVTAVASRTQIRKLSFRLSPGLTPRVGALYEPDQQKPFAALCCVVDLDSPTDRHTIWDTLRTRSSVSQTSLQCKTLHSRSRSAPRPLQFELPGADARQPSRRRSKTTGSSRRASPGRFWSENFVVLTPNPQTLRRDMQETLGCDADIVPVAAHWVEEDCEEDAGPIVTTWPTHAFADFSTSINHQGTPVDELRGDGATYQFLAANGGSTEFEEVWEYQRYYPIRGWAAPRLPRDPKPFRAEQLSRKTLPEGWAWRGTWYVASGEPGWQYSVSFLQNSAFQMKRHDFLCAFARRRRWVRHKVRTKLPAGDGPTTKTTAILTPVISNIQEDFFSAGRAHIPEAQLGPFAAVCKAMMRGMATGSLPVKERWCPHKGTRNDSFSGKDAVDWVLAYWAAKPNCYIDWNIMRSLTDVRDRSAASRSLSSLRTSSNQQVHGGVTPAASKNPSRAEALKLLERLRLQGILASSAAGLFNKVRDDHALLHFREAQTDASQLYQDVIAPITPQLEWLSPVTFDVESDWFRDVADSVAENNRLVDNFASKHRHRWKLRSHPCYNCGDKLVEDGVVGLICGHILCKECCKVFLAARQSYNAHFQLNEWLGEDIVADLLVCSVCHSPSSVKCSVSSVGLTQYEAVRTDVFVYVVDEVYQNERKNLFSNYNRKHLLVSDRAPFSDASGSVMPEPDAIGLPGPEWQFVEGWQPVTSASTDKDGWQCAFNWKREPWDDATAWSGNPDGFKFVRRRRLMRLRINAPGTRWVRDQLGKESHRRYGTSPPHSPRNAAQRNIRKSLTDFPFPRGAAAVVPR